MSCREAAVHRSCSIFAVQHSSYIGSGSSQPQWFALPVFESACLLLYHIHTAQLLLQSVWIPAVCKQFVFRKVRPHFLQPVFAGCCMPADTRISGTLCEHPGHPGRSPRPWRCRCRFQHQRGLRGPGALHPPFPPPTARAGPSRKDFPRTHHGHRHRPAPSPAPPRRRRGPGGGRRGRGRASPLVSCPHHPLGYSPAFE